jgi:hypothetical protein
MIAKPRQTKINGRNLFKSRIFVTKKKAIIKATNANASFMYPAEYNILYFIDTIINYPYTIYMGKSSRTKLTRRATKRRQKLTHRKRGQKKSSTKRIRSTRRMWGGAAYSMKEANLIVEEFAYLLKLYNNILQLTADELAEYTIDKSADAAVKEFGTAVKEFGTAAMADTESKGPQKNSVAMKNVSVATQKIFSPLDNIISKLEKITCKSAFGRCGITAQAGDTHSKRDLYELINKLANSMYKTATEEVKPKGGYIGLKQIKPLLAAFYNHFITIDRLTMKTKDGKNTSRIENIRIQSKNKTDYYEEEAKKEDKAKEEEAKEEDKAKEEEEEATGDRGTFNLATGSYNEPNTQQKDTFLFV